MAAAIVFLLLMAGLYWTATRPSDGGSFQPPPVPAPAVAQKAPAAPRRAPAKTSPATPGQPTREEIKAAIRERLAESTPAEEPDDPLPALVLSVTVSDDVGEPLRRVPVTIKRADRDRSQRFFTDGDGKLEQRLDAGLLVVFAERADGMLTSRSELVEVDGREGGAWSVELIISSEPKAGLGVNIAPADEGVRILAVHADTPAEVAGLQTGDIVTAVEGESTLGMPLVDFVERMTGPEGTKVLFDVLRPDGSEERLQVERQLLEGTHPRRGQQE